MCKIAICLALAVSIGQIGAQGQVTPSKRAAAFRAADIVDGKINYAKVLGHKKLWLLLELSDDQRQQMELLADDYFESRHVEYKKHIQQIVNRKLSKADMKAAAAVSEFDMQVPIDVEQKLGQILLPHQIDFIQTFLPLRFLLKSANVSDANPSDTTRSNKGLAKLLGVSEKEAGDLVKQIKKVQTGFHDEIRKILFEEIQSAVKLLDVDEQGDVADLLGLNEKRAELLDVSDLRSLISRRMAWKKNRSSGLRLANRTARNFVTENEKQWLGLDDLEFKELRGHFLSLLKQEWKSAESKGKRDTISFTFRPHRTAQDRFAAESRRLVELYESAERKLDSQQIEELQRLDRWRFLNVRPFTKFLTVNELQLKGNQKSGYDELLESTVQRLCEVQKLQHDKVVAMLPQSWKDKLGEIGTDNF